ncbi:MAG: restriction endonuclease subunit S [Gemmatimonadales bacterium]
MNCVDPHGGLDLAVAPRVPPIPQLDRYLLKRGDVLFNATNSPELVGKCAVFGGHTERVTFSNHFLRLRVLRDRLDPAYLARWLAFLWHRRVFQTMCAQWVNQASVRKERLLQLKPPLPLLAEQRRIAAVLDKADAVRRKRQESLRLLDEFLRSAFLEMFGDPVRNEKGWEAVALGTVAAVVGGLQVTPLRAGYGRERPYLRVANVYRDRLDLTEVKYIGVTGEELDRTRLRAGDLLIVEGHGNREEIGRSAVWDGSIEDCVHQNHLIRARVDEHRADPHYVSSFLNSAAGRRQMGRYGKTTSGLNTISTGNVKRIEILLPPLRMQRTYVRLLGEVTEARKRCQAAQRHSDLLFNALAHRAFGASHAPSIRD